MCSYRTRKGGSIINKRYIKILKDIFNFLSDRKVLIGIGIGIIIGTSVMIMSDRQQALSKAKVEEKAREYGMIYRDEVKVIFDKDVKK